MSEEDDDDRGRDLLVRGIAAARANSRDEARFFLNRALDEQPSADMRIQAWRELASITDDPAEKRGYLSRILATDPTDATARRDLAVLDGRLNPRDIIDPDRLGDSPAAAGEATTTRRLTCRRCGSGRLIFRADQQALVCEHCHAVEAIDASSANGVHDQASSEDFVATMWTLKGHKAPTTTECFSCKGCGASFLVSSAQLSFTCPYCASVYVVEQKELRQLLEPDGMVPFVVTRDAAERAMGQWVADQGIEAQVEPPRGVYHPVWVLNFFGEVLWNGLGRSDADAFNKNLEPVSGTYTIIDHPVRVPAARTETALLSAAVNDFDLGGLEPFDARRLADWPAATYEVTLEDASVRARRLAVPELRVEVREDAGPGTLNLTYDFNRVAVDSFKLILVPLWITGLRQADDRSLAIVSGQNGSVRAETKRTGMAERIDSLLSSLWRKIGEHS